MFRAILICSAIVVLFFNSNAKQPRPENLLVEYTHLYTYSKDSLLKIWDKGNIPLSMTPVNYAVDMYEVSYYGKWIDQSYIKSKGILFVPKNDTSSFAELAYCHGTRFGDIDKRGMDDKEQFVCIMSATDGYISYFPFYYGLDGGEEKHLYQHAESEAMSVIYMIKACREELFEKLNIKNNGQLYINGYSQGGHAAMATHKMLESEKFNNIEVTASAPLAGAFDMTGIMAGKLFSEYKHPYYLAYLLSSYGYAYPNLWQGDEFAIFKNPYQSIIKKYFVNPGNEKAEELNKQLPTIPAKMINDSMLYLLEDNSTDLIKTLAQNDLYDWKPKAPIYLCACKGDEQVSYENTMITYETMRENGVDNVYKKIFGKNLSHLKCAKFAIIYSKLFFDNIRAQKKNIYKTPFPQRLMLNIGVMQSNKQ